MNPITGLNWNKIEPIEGWLFEKEAQLLYAYTPMHGYVLEIGSWKGKSTNVFLQAKAKVTCIDWFKGSEETPGSDTVIEFLNNVRGKSIKIFPQRTQDVDTREIVDMFDVIYIDGAHDAVSVEHDFTKFSHLVVPGGCVIFHDAWGENGEEEKTPWPEVTAFVKDMRTRHGWTEVGKAQRVAVFQRA